MAHKSKMSLVLALAVGCVLASGVSAADKAGESLLDHRPQLLISRNLADDTLPVQGTASGSPEQAKKAEPKPDNSRSSQRNLLRMTSPPEFGPVLLDLFGDEEF